MVWAVPRCAFEVSKKDQGALEKFLDGGVQPVRAVLRAMALLPLAKGLSAPRIAEFIPLTPQAIRKVGHRYVEGGLDRALYEKQRPGAAGGQREAAHHRDGLRRPPEGLCPLDSSTGSGTSRKETAGSESRARNHSDSSSQPRPQAVAGKKCGVFRNSMKSTSRRWSV